MTLAVVRSRGLSGMSAPEVTVEVHLANGLPAFTLVGLPDTEVREARERVRAALQNSRFEFPMRRYGQPGAGRSAERIGALRPADCVGHPCRDRTAPHALDRYEFAGELSLSGELGPVRGTRDGIRRHAGHGRHRKPGVEPTVRRGFFVPSESADEAALVGQVRSIPQRRCCRSSICAPTPAMPTRRIEVHQAMVRLTPPTYPDMFDVKGQLAARRALEIAAAGGGTAR